MVVNAAANCVAGAAGGMGALACVGVGAGATGGFGTIGCTTVPMLPIEAFMGRVVMFISCDSSAGSFRVFLKSEGV